MHRRNPNLGPNSGKRILDARISDPNSWVECFDPVLPSKRGPLKNSPSTSSPFKIQPRNRANIGDRYDWTTGVPDNGNDRRKFRVVPRSHPLRPLVLHLFNRGGNRRAFRLPRGGRGSYGGTFARSYSVSIKIHIAPLEGHLADIRTDFWEGDATKQFSLKKRFFFFVKRGKAIQVNEGLGKDFYKKGNSVKRFGLFTEPLDSEN